MRTRLVATALLCTVTALAGDLRPFVRGSWQQLRRSHAGQPVIVHFWGLSCAPCVAELPQWGQLLRQRRDVSVVLVAADPVPEEAEPMTAALTKAGLASTERWMFADRDVDRLRFEIDPDWAGELPFTLFITPDGKTSHVAGTVDFPAVRTWIDSQQR